jgi:hypothetical protein
MKIAVMVRQLDLEGNDRPCSLVSHLIGNRASFLRTKTSMFRVPDELAATPVKLRLRHSNQIAVRELHSFMLGCVNNVFWGRSNSLRFLLAKSQDSFILKSG